MVRNQANRRVRQAPPSVAAMVAWAPTFQQEEDETKDQPLRRVTTLVPRSVRVRAGGCPAPYAPSPAYVFQTRQHGFRCTAAMRTFLPGSHGRMIYSTPTQHF
jgi:hypothetical protein